MKKTLYYYPAAINVVGLKQLLRIVNLAVFLLALTVSQVNAKPSSQEDVKVTIDKKNLSLGELMSEVEKQSNYLFIYSEKEIDLKQQVKIDAHNKRISDLLSEVMPANGISFSITDGYISLAKSNKQRSLYNDGSRKISGTVKLPSGEPVIGALVLIKDTNIGVISDKEGRFTLDAPENAVLSVSYIGYETQELAVGNKTQLSILLEEDVKVMDEVIVIGYGTTSTRKLASAVTVVKGEDLQNLPFNNVVSSLQGRATGVVVQQSGGEPGSIPSISIRGGNAPTYVIDGVVSSAWDFNTLNATDIESISILKDAAATAIYGARAADGIVLVKTKQGGKGVTSITYSFNSEFSQPTKLSKKVDSYTYAMEQNRIAEYDGLPPFHMYSEDVIDIIRDQSDPYTYANTDWLKLGLKSFAPEYRHSLSINGSGQLANYYLSLGVVDQGSLYKSNALTYQRYNVRSNVNTTFDKIGLTVGMNMNATYEKKDNPYVGSYTILEHLMAKLPLLPAYNEDGTYSSVTDHPLVEMDKRSGYYKNDGTFFNTQLYADLAVPGVKGLTLGTILNYRLNNTHIKSFKTKAPQFYPDGAVYPIPMPSLKEEAYFGNQYYFEVSAGYVNTFNGAHTIDVKAVFNVSESDRYEFWASRKDYLSSNVDQLFAGSPVGMQNSGTAYEGGNMGLVGRLKYDYKSRYIIEGSFRYDGSDNFAPGYRWGFFPAGTVAWALSEEPFFKSLGLNAVNLIKFRASYGQTGTTEGVSRFGYLSTYGMNEKVINIGGELQSGFSEGDLVTPELLKWYTRNSLNFGLDFSLLKNRLTGAFDYFYYVTKGGLMRPADRYTTPLGKPLPMIKSNSEHRREGVEFSVQWRDVVAKEFSYSIGFNMTYFNNLWKTKADESLSSLMNPWKRVSHQKDYYGMGLIDQGLYQTPGQIINNPRRPQSTETKMGDIAYKDVNGDGKIDGEDQVRIGMPTMPHFTYGINFDFGYKGFSLSGLLYGTGKRYLELGGRYKMGEGSHMVFKDQLDYWREDNHNAAFPRLSNTSSVNGGNNKEASTFWFRNAKFIRLRDLRLSYDFKHKLLKNVNWIGMCRLNLAGANLFSVSKINKYFDPETNSNDGSGYPVQRVISVGLTLGF